MKEQLAQFYSQHHQEKNRYGYLFCDGERGPFLKNWIGTEKKVLDLGCRDGMLTKFFVEGNEVTGVDIDTKALESIKETLSIETHWVDLNAEWPFPPNTFDSIVACEILEHVFFVEPLLENISKSLKKGGQFIGSVPNAFRMRNRWKFLFGEEFDTDPTHVRLFSYAKLDKLLASHFQEIEIIPIQGKIAPFLSVHSSMPKSITSLFAKDLLWLAK